MSDIVKASSVPVNLKSKKGRQDALKNKIAEINLRLEELGVGKQSYKVPNTISNPETMQNTISIASITCLSMLFRFLAHYKHQVNVQKAFCAQHKIIKYPLTNINGTYVEHIVHDLELRILILTNSVEINNLTAIKTKLMPFMDEESRFINTLKEVEGLLK